MDKARKLYTNGEIASFRAEPPRIYGEPASYAFNELSKDLSNQRGNFGEMIIGNILNLIACETEGFYVFHSIGLPLELAGETDHVVVYKNKIILIETKAFSGYRSLRTSESGSLKGTKHGSNKVWKVDDNHLYQKIDLYQKRFDNRNVTGILATARDGIETTSANSVYRVASMDNFFSMIRNEISTARDIKEDPWPALKFFAMLCISKR